MGAVAVQEVPVCMEEEAEKAQETEEEETEEGRRDWPRRGSW